MMFSLHPTPLQILLSPYPPNFMMLSLYSSLLPSLLFLALKI